MAESENELVFEGGAAIIRSKADGQTIVYQPFKPTMLGPVPWESEQDALDYMRTHFTSLIEVEVEIETPPTEEQPPQ